MVVPAASAPPNCPTTRRPAYIPSLPATSRLARLPRPMDGRLTQATPVSLTIRMSSARSPPMSFCPGSTAFNDALGAQMVSKADLDKVAGELKSYIRLLQWQVAVIWGLQLVTIIPGARLPLKIAAKVGAL